MNNLNIDLDNTIDEDFFGSLKGKKSSKLQQLFVDDALSSDDKEQSLKYQRPKDIATASNATSATLIAKVVTAYKQGELQGKVGMALIQNPDHTCNIIMYKTKTNILITLKLPPEKSLLYKQSKYWQFYDDQSTYCSFRFDTPADEEEFVQKLYIKSIKFNEESKSEFENLNNEAQSLNDEKSEKRIIAPTTKETKPSLIERMAKMGKPLPTLPFSNKQTLSEFSDSSDIEVIQTPLASSEKPSAAPRISNLTSNIGGQHLVPSLVGLNTVGSAVYPINPLESQYMQMLLTEQRTQSSEMRMNVCKLENKIEKVLDKLELYDRKDGNKKTEKDDEILELEEKLLMLKKENRRLKQNIVETSSEESKKNKIKDVLYELKEDFSKFNIDYKQNLKSILFELSDKLKVSHNKLQEMQQKSDEKEQKFKDLTTELDLSVMKNNEQNTEINSLNMRENELKQQLIEKETEVLKQKHEVLELQNKLQEQKQLTLKTPDDTLIKSTMNSLYMDIATKLNETNIPHSEQILSLIASSIKEQTLITLLQSKSKDKYN